MTGICSRLKFPLLRAVQAKLSPNPLYPADAHPDTVLCQIILDFLSPVGLPIPFMGCLYL